MKKKFWLFALALVLVLPIAFAFVGCKSNTDGAKEGESENRVMWNVTIHSFGDATFQVEDGTLLPRQQAPSLFLGHRFAGWFADEDCTEEFDFTKPITSNTEIWAKFVKQCTVTFETNGGSEIADIVVDKGTAVAKPQDPIKEDYNFVGWFLNENLTQSFAFETLIDEDVTIYAKWERIVCQVTVNLNYENNVRVENVYSGDNLEIDDPIREGYVFKGWYLDSGYETVFVQTDKIKSPITIFAKWAKTYIVAFDSRNGSLVDSQDIESGLYAVAPEDPTRSGYIFDGWYMDSQLKNEYKFEESPVTENTTIFAKWIAINYQISNGLKLSLLKDDDDNYIKEYQIVGYDAETLDPTPTIPKSVNGVTITMIKSAAFHNCSILQRISISSPITKIGSSAFSGCDNLTYVALNSVNEVGMGAFGNCVKLEEAFVDCQDLQQEAFFGCERLNTLTLYVRSIGREAFAWCSSLTSLRIREDVENIGKNAFNYCSNLTELIVESQDVYNNLGSDADLSHLTDNLTLVKVLKTIDDQSCDYLNDNFTRDTESDPDYYNIYTKKQV